MEVQRRLERRRLLRQAFAAWRALVAQAAFRQRRVTRLRARQAGHLLHAAFASWTAETAAARAARAAAATAANFYDRRLLQRAVAAWRGVAEESKQVRTLATRASRRVLAEKFYDWRREVLDARRLEAAGRRADALRRLGQRRAARAALQQWLVATQRAKRAAAEARTQEALRRAAEAEGREAAAAQDAVESREQAAVAVAERLAAEEVRLCM